MLSKSQVKYIQSLNQKKFRQQEGVFIAEGPKIINELLACSNIEPVVIYGTGEWWIQNDALKNNLPFVTWHELEPAELEKVSFLVTPHQVVAVFRKPFFNVDLSYDSRITLLLDNIQDPGNMGTIIRIADWFGITRIVASMDSADVFNPKVVQSTMGSIARVHVVYEELLPFLGKHRNISVYASTLTGSPLSTFGKLKEGMLIIGNESKGVNDKLLQSALHKISIPKYGQAESLNAAVATGIILSHII